MAQRRSAPDVTLERRLSSDLRALSEDLAKATSSRRDVILASSTARSDVELSVAVSWMIW